MTLGELLKQNRAQQGYSFQDVVEATGYNLSSLKKYERAGDKNGVFPPMDKLARLAALYKIDPREVFAVCADKDIDTRVFYEIDGRDSTSEEVSAALEETNAILRKYGFGALEQDEIVDEADEELDSRGVAIHDAIRSVVATLGIEARCLPSLMKDAREVHKQMEPADLIDLADNYCHLPEQYEDGLIDADNVLDKTPKEREDWCVAFSEVLITNSIYGIFFWHLDQPSLSKLCTALSITTPKELANIQTLFTVSKRLNQAIESREPIMLYDENEYQWLEALHHLPLEGLERFLAPEEVEKFAGATVRLYDRFGALADIEEPEEASLVASSSGSNPIKPTELENDDGSPPK